MSKLYIDKTTTDIQGVPVYVEYVEGFRSGGVEFYLVDAWVNYGTELEVQIAYSHAEDMLEEVVWTWLDDPEFFYGEPEIA